MKSLRNMITAPVALLPRSLADVPTVGESGLPGFEFNSWFALMEPAGTPRAIDKLSAKYGELIRKNAITAE